MFYGYCNIAINLQTSNSAIKQNNFVFSIMKDVNDLTNINVTLSSLGLKCPPFGTLNAKQGIMKIKLN